MDQPTNDEAPEQVAIEDRPGVTDPDAAARARRARRTAHVEGDRWRRDIQGLRGVAILAVVIYHADPSLLPGGFIGVDLFFVISGFLITGLLMRELEERGTISLRRFYARRIRRLLPMAFIVIAATVIAADLLQAPLDATRTAKDALSSALFVANYRFALEQTNYLYAGVGLSPFQHFWSLGVEEQMYAIWPVLLLGGAKLWQRGRTYTRGAFGILVVGSVASFVACLRLTNSNEPWAFFSFPTRAWELCVGGLIALAAPSHCDASMRAEYGDSCRWHSSSSLPPSSLPICCKRHSTRPAPRGMLFRARCSLPITASLSSRRTTCTQVSASRRSSTSGRLA